VIRTALNTRVSWWRRIRRETPLLDRAAETAGDGGLDYVVDRELMAVLMRLPPRQRQVIALRLFLDLDTAQTARTLRIAPGTVRAHLTRAIAALRADFAPAIDEELTWTTTN
jgi:RNA polymerase sigma factor (sigma-70 family)